ncbi:MAG: hypothetical protein A2Y03_09130 [Omnitrophica WOR_2 bacterium GWF2_38_59]|nr:MAG: hypothetical protein A2Y03_09130 [Omnitrophica WOR_2 bacterium GWF2_38_59]OGX51126.1 MAG: hypothetical protein A2243_08280 [Omnitrophica WOR_2 bacterium RIFOXYA2_FULL_38_17]OGX56113.1 MAG: hypothetical protein A2447_07570 [Omnitrophica WOR_2 bacterium RIFOXYC2_FULL_38_12]OGX60450.1 MAG: hypothetical protein A2306_09390 [Omnitrophica WOR_2 bacterium RIFOXYB2_FULL_38_16]HBG60873.1 hypothetical protein [Candidatus Omnitrophota bacterium]
MTDYFRKCDKDVLRIIKKVGKVADRTGIDCYIVGGIVRDLVLGKKNLDLDIVLEGDAISFAKNVNEDFGGKLNTYDGFGTASVILKNGFVVDFATARKERYAKPGALPTVRRGSLKDDLYRRDFTINALAISIRKDSFGELVDEFGGLRDIKSKKIRVLHDKSFIDDPTRILRGVRFEQRFDFKFEQRTSELLIRALEKRRERNVKAPRYFVEFKKLLAENDPVKGLKRLKVLGGLDFLTGKNKISFVLMSNVHKNIIEIKKKDIFDNKNWWLIYFMSIIKVLDDFTFNNILGKFHFKKEEKVSILYSREVELIIKRLSEKEILPSQVYEILNRLNGDVVVFTRACSKSSLVSSRIDRYLTKDRNVKLSITGKDLKAFGVESGKRIGEILETVLYWKIDNNINLKREEISLAKQLALL